MISSLGQDPCSPLAARKPFTYLYRDCMLVDEFYFRACSRKLLVMGGSNTRLWFFYDRPNRTTFFKNYLRLSSSLVKAFPFVLTLSNKKLPTVRKINHSGL
jgi:hypothetical protein